MIGLFKPLLIIYTLVIASCLIGLSIPQNYIVYVYSKYKNECHNILEWTIAASIINVITPIIIWTIIFLTSMKGSYKDEPICNFLIFFILMAQMTIMIWSTIIHFSIDQTCRDFWNSRVPRLLTYIMIEYSYFLFCISAAIILTIIYCCEKSNTPIQKKSTNNNKIIHSNIIIH